MIRPRIAVVHPQLRVGGGSEACALWAVEALRDEYDVSLISGSSVELSAFNDFYHTALEPNQVSLITVRPPALLRNPDLLSALRSYRISKYCKRVSSDFDVMFSAYSAMDFGRRGIQYILDPHFNESLLRLLNPSASKINRWFYSDSPLRKSYIKLGHWLAGYSPEGMKKNLTLVDSNWTGAFTKNYYGLETVTVYPPVLTEYPSVPWEKKEDGFICMGRIVPEKQIERAVEIVGSLRDAFPNLHLHIVGRIGDVAYAGNLKKLALNNSHWLYFEGDVSLSKKTELLSQHKYGIHGKENEPFGIVIAEMISAGCIVWVPNGGGQVEIVDHPSLIYFSPEDGRLKIERVLKDATLRELLRRHLEGRAGEFSVKKYKIEIKEIVERFLSDS
jgi:glycosyltransferase involved in cell wall biosynthesis